MCGRRFKVFLAPYEIAALQQVKLFYIKKSKVPSAAELSKVIGMSEIQAGKFLLAFEETGILKKVANSRTERVFGKRPYEIMNAEQAAIAYGN